MSCLMGENRDIFFPKLREELHLISFSEIARKYLKHLGYETYQCATESEARKRCAELIKKRQWPCYFFESDTTGEKDYEEFFSENEQLDLQKFSSIGVIKNDPNFDLEKLTFFENRINDIKSGSTWQRDDLLQLFHEMIPDFGHKETGKFLDQKM